LATPLQALAEALEEHRPGQPFAAPPAGAGTPAEVALVASRLGETTARLDAVGAELREVVRRREDEVRERTAELAGAEQRARLGEARYRVLYDRSPRAAWVYDVETLRFLSVNAAAVRLYGWSREEFLDRTILDVRPPELRGVADALARQAALEDESAYEGVHATRDGRHLDVSLVSQAIEYEGRAARLVLVEDVGERRRALAQLAASETRLREVLEALDEGVVLRSEREVLLWNGAAERILGLTGEQLSRRAPRPDGWRMLDATGAEVPAGSTAPARALAGGRREVDALLRLERPDGTHAWIAGSATPIADTADGARAVVTTVRDVTRAQEAARAVEESEARFRGVLETVRALVVTLDFDGRVTFANDALLDLTGWTRAEAVGSDWFGRFLPDADARRAALRAIMAPGGAVAHHEHEIVTRHGERRVVEWDNTLLRDASGALVGSASVGRDVTGQRAEERRLAELSTRDELTGLLNRRGFEAAVAATQGRDGAAARTAGLLALDLDGFKPINDTYGHAEGDRALRDVGRLLGEVVRGVDHAGRLGGDEFALYLADLQRPEDLARVAERLARVLAAHNDAAAAAGRPYRVRWRDGAVLREGREPLAATLARADAEVGGQAVLGRQIV
ncbi:PAS domain S-box protein, partial [Roseisolibacter sp. H3M3-2]|uniref:sensor domain-containing protein n=1 Tax=Roseisolibacter sp. H3M3-2 TaxID=3031323 RepID=UPI0023DC006E